MRRYAVTFLLMLCASSIVAASQHERGFDGVQHAQLTRTTHRFFCDSSRAQVTFEQRFRDPGEFQGSFARSVGVRVTELKIGRREVSHNQLQNAQPIFERLAWVENITARCSEGNFFVTVVGMPLEEWIAHLSDAPTPSPNPITRVISLSPSGRVVALP